MMTTITTYRKKKRGEKWKDGEKMCMRTEQVYVFCGLSRGEFLLAFVRNETFVQGQRAKFKGVKKLEK